MYRRCSAYQISAFVGCGLLMSPVCMGTVQIQLRSAHLVDSCYSPASVHDPQSLRLCRISALVSGSPTRCRAQPDLGHNLTLIFFVYSYSSMPFRNLYLRPLDGCVEMITQASIDNSVTCLGCFYFCVEGICHSCHPSAKLSTVAINLKNVWSKRRAYPKNSWPIDQSAIESREKLAPGVDSCRHRQRRCYISFLRPDSRHGAT